MGAGPGHAYKMSLLGQSSIPGGGVNLLSVHCTVSHVRQDEGIKGTARRDI